MKRLVILLTIFFALTDGVDTQNLGGGSTVGNFSLPDLNGNVQTFSRLKGQKGAVVIFLGAECSVVKGYKDRINRFAAEAGAKGVNFIGINSNANESLAVIGAIALESGYKFPILIDKDGKIADMFGARNTPDAYLLSAENVLLYRGAIDNNHAGGIGENFLKDAINASIAGKPVLRKSVMPTGCTIKRGPSATMN